MTVDQDGQSPVGGGPGRVCRRLRLHVSGMPFDLSDLSSQFSNLVFPADGTAKVGEEWESTATVPMTGMDQEISATTKAKLTAASTENGREVATIDYTTAVPMDSPWTSARCSRPCSRGSVAVKRCRLKTSSSS